MNTCPASRIQSVLLKSTVSVIVCLWIALIAGRFIPLQRGLLANYYPNIQWSEPAAFSLINPVINLDTVYNRRLVFPNKRYSIYWKGWIRIDQPGNYLFATRSDDGSNVYINGKLLIDNGGFHAVREIAEPIDLKAGFHQIEIGYFQGEARDAMAVYWQPPGQERTLLPTEVLFPEKPTAGRLLLEQIMPSAVIVLTLLTLLLLGVTTGVYRKRLYQDLKRTIQKKVALQHHFKKYTGELWHEIVSRKRLRRGICSILGVLFTTFLLLYWAQADHGLVGMYYDNQVWNNSPVFSTPESSLNPQTLYHKARRPQEPNSLRWVGWLFIRSAADYRFSVNTEGALSFKVDDLEVIKKAHNDRIQTKVANIYLPGGLYQIDLKYKPGTGTAHILDLRWGTKEAVMKPIPGRLLFQEQPNKRQLALRTVASWMYWGILVLGTIVFVVVSIGVFLHQIPVIEWLKQRHIFRKITMLIDLNASIHPVLRQTWTHLLLLVILSLLLVFDNLGRGSIITTDFDEGVHTRVIQYMAKTGIWWYLSSSEGVPYYNKPPLKIWLSALTVNVFGDSEFVLRIWDAVFGLLTFIVLYFWGKVLFSSKAVGLLAVLILMGGRDFLLNHNMRTGVMDSLMMFFVVSSLLFFSLREQRSYFYYLSGLCIGFGALTKSVQAFVALIIIVLYLILTKQYAELKTRPFWGMLGFALLLPALWYIPQILFSPGFFEVSIVKQIFHRVQGKIHRPHVQGPFYFFSVIYHGFFPWSLLAVPAIGIGFWQAICRKKREMIFLLTWIFTVFIGFSLSKMKVAWYMNPLYPALALLIAMVGYTIITALKNKYPASPLLAPLLIGVLLIFLLSALCANFQRVHENPEKLPIHILTDYLRDQEDAQYRLVVYDLQVRELDYADAYYLDRVPADHIIHTDDIRVIEQLSRQHIPLFVLLKRAAYDTHSLFREHRYHYPLAPVYANVRYPQKLVLVYNHVPDNPWFIKQENK